MTVRPGQLDGFKKQAAECIRRTLELTRRDRRVVAQRNFLAQNLVLCDRFGAGRGILPGNNDRISPAACRTGS
jgi:hypothetical protein